MKRTRHPTLVIGPRWLAPYRVVLIPHTMTRVALRFAPLAFICAVACTEQPAAKPTEGDIGGSMIIVQPVEPATLFPPRMNGTEGLPIIDAIFDHLAEIGPDLAVDTDKGYVPRLATAWKWIERFEHEQWAGRALL